MLNFTRVLFPLAGAGLIDQISQAVPIQIHQGTALHRQIHERRVFNTDFRSSSPCFNQETRAVILETITPALVIDHYGMKGRFTEAVTDLRDVKLPQSN